MKLLKKKILRSLKNTYCRLRPSKIHGIGVFAMKEIKKGINPFHAPKKLAWVKFNISELNTLNKEVLQLINDFYVAEGNNIYLSEGAINGIDMSFFINNSKEPNMKTIDDGNTFISLKKIKRGEELTVSYATYDKNLHDKRT